MSNYKLQLNFTQPTDKQVRKALNKVVWWVTPQDMEWSTAKKSVKVQVKGTDSFIISYKLPKSADNGKLVAKIANSIARDVPSFKTFTVK